ncbi:MAG: DUF4124 domain-containing protein [Nitrospirae bacterium]|nr:DUF4124 domain-containing protein [Nitrospirota bacterium]
MGKRLILAVLLILLSVSLTQNIAEAALYRWIDKSGQSHVTDYPPPNEEDTEATSQEDTKKPEAAPPETKASPVPPVTVATPKPVTPTPPPVAAATPQPSKTTPSAPPAIAATPAPAQPPAAAARTPRPLPKPGITAPKGKIPENGVSKGFPLPFNLRVVFLSVLLFIIFAGIIHNYYFYKIAVRLSVPMPWMAWIPILNIYTMVQASGRPLWWILIIVFMPILAVVPWIDICERLGINKKYGLLYIALVIGPIFAALVMIVPPFLLGSFPPAMPIISGVLLLLSILIVIAQPAVCYRAANKARKEDSSSYMPGGPSLPDYEHDTLPYNQPDYEGQPVTESSDISAGAEFPVGDDVSVYETGDDETVVIASPKEHDEFTVEESFDRDAGAESEAITMDPEDAAAYSEAFTLDGDIPEGKDISGTFGKESEASSGVYEKEDEELDFTLDDFSIDSEPKAGTSSQPEGQREQDEDYKLEIDDLTVIEPDVDAGVQPEIEIKQEPDTSSEIEFQLELDDLPAADSDTYKPEGLGLPQDDDAQPGTEQVSSGSDVDLELAIDMNSGGDAFSAGVDNYGKTDVPIAGTAETEEEGLQIELPPEFSLEIAGAPSEPSEMEIGLETTVEQEEYDISSDLSLDIDFPTEDASGNLKIDISEFKSLAAMVELEMVQETAGTADPEYDLSPELPSETGAAAADMASILPEDPEPDVKPPKGAKAKKEPMTETTPQVQAKPKKGAKLKKEPVPAQEAKPIEPAKPKAPPMPEKERTLEDILIDGLKLEMDEPGKDDGPKEGKP